MLHPLSQKTIDETFALYKYGGEKIPDVLNGKTIIHIYPGEDTRDGNGELSGYYQCLFFRMVVFNINKGKNIVYRPARRYDCIFTTGCNFRSISVFKDGAFCGEIEGKVKFLDGQACTFYTE